MQTSAPDPALQRATQSKQTGRRPLAARDRILLLVDDDPLLLAAVGRCLAPHFAKVCYATTPQSALILLDRLPVTHLVCDLDLGPRSPRGLDLVPILRARRTTIQHAVLYTGSEIDVLDVPAEVDHVVHKAAGTAALLEALEATT